MSVFKKLNEINVNEHTEEKGKFTYLSWSFAWSELKKAYPGATSKVYHDENTNMPYFASKAGVMVKVGVTVDELEHISYLPVMDFRNESIQLDKVNMMDINKAIQRCTVKAIALHGLGLYIYAGEDLPTITLDLNDCKTLAELATMFKSMSSAEQKQNEALKNQLKTTLK